MLCREFLEYSERWMEGERDASAVAHLKSCALCSALVADLDWIAGSATALSEAEPPAHVWVSLRNQLEAEGLLRATATASECHKFLQYAQLWMEGQRDAAAAAHLQSCACCRALVADLESIGQAAPAMAEREPPERVWVSLRNQLELEGLIREPADAAVALPARTRSGLFFGWRPALAGSFLALFILLSGFVAYRSGSLLPRQAAQEQPAGAYVPGSEVLEELAAIARAPVPEIHEHNPLVTAAFRQNLEIVDNAIAICEKTVKAEPKNEVAREHLLSAYQQRADLLASMSQRGALGD
jgi:hypothetical protein